MNIENATIFDAAVLPLINPQGGNLLTVIVKGTFVFNPGGSEPADEQIPISYGDSYYGERGSIRYESDIVPFKPKADVVLCATAYAPDSKPAESIRVAVKIGSLEKQVMVFGERFWNHAGVLSRKFTMTATKPFLRRSIVYEDAFGGIDTISGQYCAENLVGKGFYSPASKQNLAGKPLPCIEDPCHLIRTPGDHPRPVGFGFYSRAWQPRVAYAGTYDLTWRKHRYPLLPRDFDAQFYNGAHPDLQINGYLHGNESVTLINLTPEGRADWRLPNVRLTCAISRRGKSERREKQALPMKLDTLFIEPDERRCCMVWRASTPLREPSGADIEQVTIGCGKA